MMPPAVALIPKAKARRVGAMEFAFMASLAFPHGRLD